MSQLVIRESSNLDETSSNNDLSDWQRDDMIYVKRMMKSTNKTDQRLLKLYKVRKAHQSGIHIGFSEQAHIAPFKLPTRIDSNIQLIRDDMIIPMEGEKMRNRSKSVFVPNHLPNLRR